MHYTLTVWFEALEMMERNLVLCHIQGKWSCIKIILTHFIGCLLWLNQMKRDNCYFCIWTQILLQCFPWFENLLVVLDGETSVYRCSVANGHARDQQLWNLQQNDFVWMSVIYNISQTIHRPSRLHRFLRKTPVQCKD